MDACEWNEDLSVGVEAIDAEHKEWIAHLNRLAQAVAGHAGADRLAETLTFLIDYTQRHFAAEERLMDRHGYPDAAAHKARHDELRQTLAELERDYVEEGASHVLADAANHVLRDWLLRHIREIDRRFGLYLRDRAAHGAPKA